MDRRDTTMEDAGERFSEIDEVGLEAISGGRDIPHDGVIEIGLHRAEGEGTMNQVSTDSKPLKRGSRLLCLRSVAAAGSLLNYWTDFGRLFTKLP